MVALKVLGILNTWTPIMLIMIQTLIKPVPCYASVIWTATQNVTQLLRLFERKYYLGFMVLDKVEDWLLIWNSEIYNLQKDLTIVDDIRYFENGI
jgi:hypothetical protein